MTTAPCSPAGGRNDADSPILAVMGLAHILLGCRNGCARAKPESGHGARTVRRSYLADGWNRPVRRASRRAACW
eukprot:4886454-Prymnesium_polylepis.2